MLVYQRVKIVSSPRYILYISSYSPATGMPCFLPTKLGFKTPSSTFSYNTCHELGLNLNLQFLREAAVIQCMAYIAHDSFERRSKSRRFEDVIFCIMLSIALTISPKMPHFFNFPTCILRFVPVYVAFIVWHFVFLDSSWVFILATIIIIIIIKFHVCSLS